MHPHDSAFALARYQHCLVGFLLDDRSFSLDYMQQYVRTYWGLPARVIHKDKNCYYNKLEGAEHCAMVLHNGPYAIDGALIVVGRLEPESHPKLRLVAENSHLICLYGLPVEYLTQQAARHIASAIGEVQESTVTTITTRHPGVIFQEELERQAAMLPLTEIQNQRDHDNDNNWSLLEDFMIPEDPHDMPVNRIQAEGMTQHPHPRTTPGDEAGSSNPVTRNIQIRHTIKNGEIIEHQYMEVGAFKISLLEYRVGNAEEAPQSTPQQPLPEEGFAFAAEFMVTADSEIPRNPREIDPMPRACFIMWQPWCPTELSHNFPNAIQYNVSTSLSPIIEEEETEPNTELFLTAAHRRRWNKEGKRKQGESSATEASDVEQSDNPPSPARQFSPPPPVLETIEPPLMMPCEDISNTEATMEWAIQEAGITLGAGKATAKRKIQQLLEIKKFQRRRTREADLLEGRNSVTNIEVPRIQRNQTRLPEKPPSWRFSIMIFFSFSRMVYSNCRI
ncbi:OLC1v1016137C1 [Oldenlandia corymbosa var. corymbosa]|uniref:OLC1v1016137C1 n=1 Tax=Oldenlandia corymbosa var. corymbosa TaxID=529605 RepID=A0AAV1E528_OLDCO|nr:OLC1v1016137C1 [Oldenlandia corymbosa var. corymbosa]